MRKRIVVYLLVICLLAGMTPVQALASEAELLEELPEIADDALGPEEQTLRRDESARLHRLLHALPEPYKEVFSLRVFAQLSFREIGSLFGKSENWACVVYHRARTKLQNREDDR